MGQGRNASNILCSTKGNSIELFSLAFSLQLPDNKKEGELAVQQIEKGKGRLTVVRGL